IDRALSPLATRSQATRRCSSVNLGLRPMCAPTLRAAARPSLARFTIRWRSSSARALRNAMKPRPIGVVRSRCGLSSTLIMAPRAWIRSMMCTPSIIERVARSHSATTSTSPLPSALIAFSSCGRTLVALPDALRYDGGNRRAARGGYLRDVGHFGGVAGEAAVAPAERGRGRRLVLRRGEHRGHLQAAPGGAGDRLGAVPKPLGSEPSLNDWVLCRFRQMRSKAVASTVLIGGSANAAI